jgi:peptidoglycan/xylan/chitin deacetylase (PgdA/CDA1 family)
MDQYRSPDQPINYTRRRLVALVAVVGLVVAIVAGCNSVLQGVTGPSQTDTAGTPSGDGSDTGGNGGDVDQDPQRQPTTTAKPTTTTTSTTTTTIPERDSVGPWPGPGQVALTFDDGPDPTWSGPIMEVLADYDVPATFFVLGTSVIRWPEIALDMVQAGHSVQNHSWNHPALTGLGDAAVVEELSKASVAIEEATTVAPTCMRPPYGAVDARVEQLALTVGLDTVRWNVDPSDYQQPPPAQMVANVANAADVAEGGPLVVLLHDGGGTRQQTLAALPAIIDTLLERDYEFVTIC